jgi:hypothetical protein
LIKRICFLSHGLLKPSGSVCSHESNIRRPKPER